MVKWQGGEQVGLQAGLALMVYDGLTGRPAESGILTIRGEQTLQVQKKPGGILVFLNLPGEPFRFRLESPVYEPAGFEIQPQEGICIVKKYYLNPGPAYPLRPGVMRFSGTAEPGTMVYAAADGQNRRLRLLKDGQPGDETLWIYSMGGEDFSGRFLCLLSPEGEEWIRLGEALSEMSGYSLKKPLFGFHKKAITKVLPIYSGRADAKGCYQVLLPEENGRILTWNQGRDGTWKKQETEKKTWDFVCAKEQL